MPGIHWLSSMSVGIDEFDRAHRGYIQSLHDIAAALRSGSVVQAASLCRNFMALAQEHGRREHDFLAGFNYSRLDLIERTQAETQARIQVLQDAIGNDAAQALTMIDQMQAAVVAYLLKGDINFKSFVQVLREDGLLADYPPPPEKD